MRNISWKKAIIGAAVLLGGWYIYHHFLEESGIVPQSPEQLREREEREADQLQENAILYESRDRMQKATEALRQRDYSVAARHFREANADLKRHARTHSMRDAQTPGIFAIGREKLIEDYLQLVKAEFRVLLDQLVAGQVAPATAEIFAGDYNTHVPLVARYADFRDEICAARARAATRWLRIILPAWQPEITRELRDVLERKWIAPAGYRLVFGEPMSALEQTATWKELKVMYVETAAQGALSPHGAGRSEGDSMLTGPARAELRFAMTGETNVISTWDQIGPFVARRRSSARPTAEDVMTDKPQRLLWQQLFAKLATIRPFALFPGVDADSLRLTTDAGEIREADAFAMQLLDPERLRRELTLLLGQTQAQQALRRLIIALELDSFADWLTASLEDASPQDRAALQPLLQIHPWVGDYEPILMLATGVGRTPGRSTIGVIRSQLPDPALRKRMLKHINDRSDANRAGLARFYIESVSARHLKPCLAWILDENSDFAMTAYDALQRRDAQSADEQLLRNYDRVAPNLRARMISTFWYNPDRHGAREIAILLDAAEQTDDERLARLATTAIRRASMHPRGWDAYRALGRPADDVAAFEYDSTLALHVRRARPKLADGFLLGLLFKTQADIDVAGRRQKLRETPTWLSGENRMKDVRNQAVALLLDGDENKQTVVEAFLELTKRYANDTELRRMILVHINQRKQARGLPYGGEAMRDMVLFGIRSADAIVRERAYDICAYALDQGHADYHALLQQATTTEENPKLRIKLQKLLRDSSD